MEAETKKEGVPAVHHKLKTQRDFEIKVIRTRYQFPFLLFPVLIGSCWNAVIMSHLQCYDSYAPTQASGEEETAAPLSMGGRRDCHLPDNMFFQCPVGRLLKLSVSTWEVLNFIFYKEKYSFIIEVKYTNIMYTLTGYVASLSPVNFGFLIYKMGLINVL